MRIWRCFAIIPRIRKGEWDEAEPLLASKKSLRFSLRDTLVSLGILLAFAALSFALQGFDPQNNFVSMLFLLAVFLIATVTDGYFYGIASSFLSVLLVNYLFTYPYFRFNFTLAGYPIAIVTMLAVSFTTSALTSKAKRNAAARLEADREKTRGNLLRAVSPRSAHTADRHFGRFLRAFGA